MCERLFAPSENPIVKLNTTVYVAMMLFQLKKTFAQSKSIHFPMLIKALKLEKIMGQKQVRNI